MTKIALILPYFRGLPDFFQLWLKSCGANPSIDWFVFTDDRRIKETAKAEPTATNRRE